MGCSSSKSKDVIHILQDETGAEEAVPVPHHGANELPPMLHEAEFEPDVHIAWIIDDAVARTKALPRRKQVIDITNHAMNNSD